MLLVFLLGLLGFLDFLLDLGLLEICNLGRLKADDLLERLRTREWSREW